MDQRPHDMPPAEHTRQAVAMLALVALKDEDFRHGRVFSHDEVFAIARRHLAKLRGRRKPSAPT